MVIAVALIVIIVGSVLFHWISPWWTTPLASHWQQMDDTLTLRPKNLYNHAIADTNNRRSPKHTISLNFSIPSLQHKKGRPNNTTET